MAGDGPGSSVHIQGGVMDATGKTTGGIHALGFTDFQRKVSFLSSELDQVLLAFRFAVLRAKRRGPVEFHRGQSGAAHFHAGRHLRPGHERGGCRW